MDYVVDPMTPEERSAQMAKVRGKGNKSTEALVERALLDSEITDWTKHTKILKTTPDFYFPRYRLALFVDGCFWHACPICKRRTPYARSEFWGTKIDQNRRRDNRIRRKLRQQGYHVIRIWEHDLKRNIWLKRLRAMFTRIERQEPV